MDTIDSAVKVMTQWDTAVNHFILWALLYSDEWPDDGCWSGPAGLMYTAY